MEKQCPMPLMNEELGTAIQDLSFIQKPREVQLLNWLLSQVRILAVAEVRGEGHDLDGPAGVLEAAVHGTVGTDHDRKVGAF